jgi:hypothetical protein
MKHHAGTGLPHHRQNSRDRVRSCDCEMNLNSEGTAMQLLRQDNDMSFFCLFGY